MHVRVGISKFITYNGIDRKQNIQYFSHDINYAITSLFDYTWRIYKYIYKLHIFYVLVN